MSLSLSNDFATTQPPNGGLRYWFGEPQANFANGKH